MQFKKVNTIELVELFVVVATMVLTMMFCVIEFKTNAILFDSFDAIHVCTKKLSNIGSFKVNQLPFLHS